MFEQNDRRLIQDYLPTRAISAEASREKSIRKGHISILHLWWASRPLGRLPCNGLWRPRKAFSPLRRCCGEGSYEQQGKTGISRLMSKWAYRSRAGLTPRP